MPKKNKAKGLPKRTGKRAHKFARYFANSRAKKLRNIAKNNPNNSI